jgi:hypothetical protein
MNNTEIAWWSFNGTFMDMYSNDKMQFELDASNAYTTKSSLLADLVTRNHMTFRALDPKQAKDFVIPLDKPIEMIAFWSDYTD